MVQVFGSKSRYLILMRSLYIAASFSMLCGILYVVFSYLRINLFGPQSPTLLSVIVASLLYLPLYLWTKRNFEKYLVDALMFHKGMRGEQVIRDELSKLPDGYTVFQDVKIPGQWGNIDFVVLGPQGIFTIEVKSHQGKITFDGRELLKYGSRFLEKNFLTQAMQQALRLNHYLEKEIGKNPFIHPVIVFSSERAMMQFGFKKLKGVQVVQTRFLIDLLLHETDTLSFEDIVAAKNVLMNCVKPDYHKSS